MRDPPRESIESDLGYKTIGTKARSEGEKPALTSRADTNCKGRSAVFMSGIFDSRSKSAFAMLVSSSDGCCLDGLVAAILFRAAAMIAVRWFGAMVNDSMAWEEKEGVFDFGLCAGLRESRLQLRVP